MNHDHHIQQESTDFKGCTILVYMILNGKGYLSGCGLYGFHLFLTGQSNVSKQYIFSLLSSVVVYVLSGGGLYQVRT